VDTRALAPVIETGFTLFAPILLGLLACLPLVKAVTGRGEGVAAVCERVVGGLGYAASWLLAAMTVILLIVVAGAFVYGEGATALQESALILHGAVFLLVAGWALTAGAHVRVDILYRGLDERGRGLIDLAGFYLFLLPLAFSLVIYGGPYAAAAWRVAERSAEAGGLQGIFLWKTLIPLTGLLIGLAGTAHATRAAGSWRSARRGA
jgi:TRAP-type mannitol/chloroaromatic compound transport system permease small subunit